MKLGENIHLIYWNLGGVATWNRWTQGFNPIQNVMKYDNSIQFIYSIDLNIFQISSKDNVHKQLVIEKLTKLFVVSSDHVYP